MMSQEQLKVDYWSVIVKLSYSVANYVITAQQSSWSQITDCCFFFVISLGSLLAHFTDLQGSETSHTVSVSCGRGPRGPDSGSGPMSRPNLDHICHDENCRNLRTFPPTFSYQPKQSRMTIFGHGSKNIRLKKWFFGGPKSFFRNLFFFFWWFSISLLSFDHFLHNNS